MRERDRTELPSDLHAVEVALEDERVVIVSFALPPEGRDRLTSSERAVAAMICEGKSNATIARDRGTSVRTVANQVANIFRKLGLSSRAELVALELLD